MKITTSVLALLLTTMAPAISQQYTAPTLTGKIEASNDASPVSAPQFSGAGTEEHHACRLRRIGHGLAQAARFAGRMTEQAVYVAAQAAAKGAQAYAASAAQPYYGSGLTGLYAYGGGEADSAATYATTSDTDSCNHGYTYATCPYGYNGNSYGTPYISGAGATRLQSDHVGGYRFYGTNGVSGVARPDLMGGYRISTWSQGRMSNVYTASSAPHLNAGFRRR